MAVAFGPIAHDTCVLGCVDNPDACKNFQGDNLPSCRREFTECSPDNFIYLE